MKEIDMKTIYVILLAFCLSNGVAHSQIASREKDQKTNGPMSVSTSYFGEMITHPGLNLGINYQLSSWLKYSGKKSEKKGEAVYIRKFFILSANFGGFYHHRYQTGYFGIIEPKYRRENRVGNFWELGLGAGYLKTVTPSVLVENNDLKTKNIGHDYFLSGISIAFGKDLTPTKNIPIELFVKPQFFYALPHFPKGVGYFALELGMNYIFKIS